jgi:alpha-tubulin suppressor-like RCC1 family protein
MSPRITIVVLLLVMNALAAACKRDAVGPPARVATTLESVSGDDQQGAAGAALGEDLVVRVKDQDGKPLGQVTVTWQVSEGGGSLSAASSVTDAQGLARSRWTLGNLVAPNQARAVVQGLNPAVFVARSVAGTAARVTVTPGTASFSALEDTLRIQAAVADQHGNQIAGASVTWTSENTAVAIIDPQGLVRSKGNGSAKIRASAAGGSGAASGEVTVTVNQVPVAVTISPATNQIDEGAQAQLSAEVRDRNASVITGAQVTWSSSDAAVAEVDATGKVTGKAGGDVTITARSGEAAGQATAHVRGRPQGIVLETISAGDYHSCGIAVSGAAYCWGHNNQGQLGDGRPGTHSATPVAVGAGHTFAQITVGDFHTCGVTTAGKAYCWGNNDFGKLGVGDYGVIRTTPAAVVGGHTFRQLSAEADHTCGTTTSAETYCWGYNGHGQLGNGSTAHSFGIPVRVLGGHSFAQVSAGRHLSCGVTTAGAVYCWGLNDTGQLGNGSVGGFSSTPVRVSGTQNFMQVGAGYLHACAITVAGAAYCWGANTNGQVGDASTTSRLTPTAVAGGHVFRHIGVGDRSTCGVTTSYVAYCWGDNFGGHLSVGSGLGVVPTPTALVGGHRWRQMFTGSVHSCGVATSGAAYCWGGNGAGQLGTGSFGGGTVAPTPVVGGVTFK